VSALGRAALTLVGDPARATATASALALCTAPLLFLATFLSGVWLARSPSAALALRFAAALAFGACLLVTTSGLRLAFPCAENAHAPGTTDR
jgi:hypothetical protein